MVGLLCLTLLILFLLKDTQNNSKNSLPQEPQCSKQVTCLNCNLLLISVDSLRADHVGVLGYKRNTTPNFDSFAKKGILFKNYFPASYLTPISEMSLHSGMYPSGSKMNTFDVAMSDKYTTIAQILKIDGYKTFAGHSSPEFTENPAIKDSFNRGYDNYSLIDPIQVFVDIRKIPPIELFNKLLDRYSSSKNKFFGWITLGNVHWPFGEKAPNVFADPNYNGILKNQTLSWSTFSNIYNGVFYPDKDPFTDLDRKYVIDMYDNGVKNADNFLGDIVAELEKRKLSDNTVIVISSEHGEDLGEHGYFAHYDVFDTQVHTPLLIVYPHAKIMTISSLISSTDVLPTILDVLGIGKPTQIQGKSVLPVICGDEQDDRDTVYIERSPLWEESIIASQLKVLNNIQVGSGNKDIALRTFKWKYIKRYSKDAMDKFSWWGFITNKKITIPKEELYDIVNDPYELVNVADKYPQITKEFSEKVSQWLKSVEQNPLKTKQYNKIQDYF